MTRCCSFHCRVISRHYRPTVTTSPTLSASIRATVMVCNLSLNWNMYYIIIISFMMYPASIYISSKNKPPILVNTRQRQCRPYICFGQLRDHWLRARRRPSAAQPWTVNHYTASALYTSSMNRQVLKLMIFCNMQGRSRWSGRVIVVGLLSYHYGLLTD